MEPLHPPRSVGVDALNVAHWCGRTPQLRLPLALLAALHRRGFEARLYFDASAPYRFAADGACYAELRQHAALCIEVPPGRSADSALLRDARARGGCIVSRDHFSDHRRRYRKLIDEPGRVLAGFVREEVMHLPGLDLLVPLPVTADEAWQQLSPSLNTETSAAIPSAD